MYGYPRAVCQACGRQYSGWGLATRKACDCGGKLIFSSPYNVLMDWLKFRRYARW